MRPISLTLVLVGLLVACGGSGGASSDEVDDRIAVPPSPSSTEAPDVAAEGLSDPDDVQIPVADPEAAVASWVELWAGAEMLATDSDAARTAIEAVASAQVFDQLNTIYNPSVDSSLASTPRTFVNNPTATAGEDGVVEINDCIFESPRLGNATIWYSGSVESIDGMWTVSSVEVRSEIGCVPAEIASEAIAGYEAYWDARTVFWDPADPSSPLLGETMTGIHLDLIAGLVVDHEQQGLVLRGRAETRPEVVEVRSATEIAILDCSIQDVGRGLFDGATGDRLPDIPTVSEGQTDLTSAVMILEDGTWKVSDVQGQADVSCDAAPTPQGLPTV